MKIAVVGQGYVGLPLSLAACKAGFTVVGIDSDSQKVLNLSIGQTEIEDIDLSILQREINLGRYLPTTNFKDLLDCKIILICVPTPLTSANLPDLSAVENALFNVGKFLTEGSLVVLESTVEPGTTRHIMVPILEKASGLGSSKFFVAFSPERIDPTNRQWGVENTPKIVAGLTKEAQQVAVDFYSRFVKEVVEVASLEVAETAKLLENSFRLINISFINEISIICQKLGIEVNEVISAASTKPYGFMPFYPSIGVGGHCIPVDPIYLAHKAVEIGASSQFINLAVKVNQEMPNYFVDRAELILGSLASKRILVIGISYKSNVADVRETPVKDLIKGLVEKGAKVSWHDDLVKKWEGSESVPLSSDYDLAILATPHDGVDLSILGKTPILNTRSSN
jgi:UDP-N-acetyl-D-glucosamine dehydrogenase